ncbi:MAG: hypothetical protein M1827_006005 [Pycnora praestabilis]|nr:MAG: hypothetical protein M1827_006005 [Pycnora praestabilis]
MANANSGDASKAENRHSHGHRERRLKVGKSPLVVRSIQNPETQQVSDAPAIEDLRKARADFYSKPSSERNRIKPSVMTYISESLSEVAQPKSSSRSRSGRSEGRVRRKHHTDHRDQHQTVEEHPDDEEDLGYVYRPATERRTSTGALGATTARPHTISSRSTPSVHSAKKRKVVRPTERTSSTRSHSVQATSLNDREGPSRRVGTRRSSSGSDVNRTEPPRLSRSTSDRSEAVSRTARPPLHRSNTTSRAHTSTARSVSYTTPSIATILEGKERTMDALPASRRSSGLFGLFFKSSAPEKQIECLTCMSDDISVSKSAKLACGHRMCHECLMRIFNLSITDPQHMPPKCCTADHIPLKHVDRLFDRNFKNKWNRKYQEFTAKNRIYCPAKGCGEWIKPSNIHTDTSGGASHGRKYGKCGRCRLKVCCLCNGKWHSAKDCPKDEETKKFAEIAKEKGWQRCFNCSAMVELKEGCNHMTCRCKAEFCILCGLKWKTCDCPWFNYEAVENDRLHHMYIPRQIPLRRFPPNRGADRPLPPLPPRGYNEEIGRMQQQEHRDEAMARRFQVLGLNDNRELIGRQGEEFGVGNAGNNLMNDNFVRVAAEILTGDFGHAQAAVNRVRETRNNVGERRQQPQPPAPTPPAPGAAAEHQLQRRSTASRQHNNSPRARAPGRVVPRQTLTGYLRAAYQPLEMD